MPTPFPTDWNVYLQNMGQAPEEDLMAPAPDPMESFRMPSDSTVSPQQLGQAIDFMYGLQKRKEASRQAAMRYQGISDFHRMRNQLLKENRPQEEATYQAFLGAAPKMFANDPMRMAQSIRYMRPTVTKPGRQFPTAQEAGISKLLFDQLNNLQAETKAIEKEWMLQGGKLAGPEITNALRLSREALDAKTKEIQEHMAKVDARMGNPSGFPMPGSNMPTMGQPTEDTEEGDYGGPTGAVPAPAPAQAAARTAAPGISQEQMRGALPMPKSKAELKKGLPYNTGKGIWIWDGTRFVR